MNTNKFMVLLPINLNANLLVELTNGDSSKNSIMKLRYAQLIYAAAREGFSLAAHDAEVAAKAIEHALDACRHTFNYGEVPVSELVDYVGQLRAKSKP